MQKENTIMTMNRRSFLAGGLAGTAAALSGATHATPILAPKKWDETHDVVIVGAGAAGLTAACEAVDRKLSAVVFEKMPIMGGSSVLCGGMIAVSDTDEQKAQNIKDSHDLFVKDLIVSGSGYADEKVVRAYVSAIREHYEWLTKKLGLKPDAIVLQGGQSVARSHHFSPSKILMAMADYAKKGGADIRTKCAVERLIWSSDMKKIEGVRVKTGEKTITVRAKKGVLLAAGGFSSNPTLLGRHNPPLKNAAVIAGKGTQGDGILMGLSVGADFLDTAYIKASYGFKLNPVSIDEMGQIYWSGGIIVNKNCKRFVDESISYKKLGDAALAQPEGKSWMVFDHAMLERDYKVNPQGRELWKPILEEKKIPDYLSSGATIEEAAKNAGLDPKALAETVKRYNGFVDQGRDADCGRMYMASGNGKLVRIEKGPFYVMPATAAMIGTYCGLRIDEDARVIDVWGDAIPGLWAAGEVTGGFHGAGYISGTAFAKGQAFGHLAVKSMAKA